MKISMDISDVLLYLDLIKRNKRRLDIYKLDFLLFILKNYADLKEAYNKMIELKFNLPLKFYSLLINFIEDYEDCIKIKNEILKRTKSPQKYGRIFIHQILLSKTEEQAANIIKEAKYYKIELGKVWLTRYDSMEKIKDNQEKWREMTKKQNDIFRFSEIYTEYIDMKTEYFKSLSLQQIKQKILDKQGNQNVHRTIRTTFYNRRIFIKEFAKKASNGRCQLCQKPAPFIDKQGNPFLEVHHIEYLSRGGSDSIDNVVALCPNCHRKMHQLELEDDVQNLKEKALLYSRN